MLESKTSKLEMNPKFEVVYKGNIFEIVTWEGKPGIKFEAAIRAPGVRLLIETEKDGMKALLMTKEIRREAEGVDYRLPGGKVFDSIDEFNLHRNNKNDMCTITEYAARKEGKEEAGVYSGEYIALEVSKAGASVDWDLHYFKVINAKVGEQDLEENEQGDIETVVLSAEEIFEKLSKREIKEGRSADMLWSWLQNNGFIQFKNNI